MTTTTANTIVAAGYVLHNDDVIIGIGATPQAALDDARNADCYGWVEFPAYDEDGKEIDYFANHPGGYKVMPATQALIDQAREDSMRYWKDVGGVLCTDAEAEYATTTRVIISNTVEHETASFADACVMRGDTILARFPITWSVDTDGDWGWAGEDNWEVTEANAERVGVDPEELVSLITAAVDEFVSEAA